MTVKELIETYGDEEVGITIYDNYDDTALIRHVWKSDYAVIQKYHKYDNNEVVTWLFEKGKMVVYIR